MIKKVANLQVPALKGMTPLGLPDHDLRCSKDGCSKRAAHTDPTDPNNVDVLCGRHYTATLEAMPIDRLRGHAFPNAKKKRSHRDPAAEGAAGAQHDAAAAQAATRALGKVVVVTVPNAQSTVPDIIFETDVAGLAYQFKGGLDPKSVVGMWAPQHFEDANTVARWLIEVRDRRAS